jgi:DNA-binding NtrC family response regulator
VQTNPDETTQTRLSEILECLSEPTIVVGRDLAIKAVNQRFLALYAGGQEVLGRSCYEVSHGSPRPCALAGEECPLRGCGRSGQTRRALHVHQTPRGLEHVEVTVRPIRDSSGKVTSFVESLRSSTIASAQPRGDRLVGRAPSFNRMLERVERVAPSDSSLLLTGEPGSGREAVARAVHQISPRSRRPFIAIECSGAREPWFEMELFGSVDERGARESSRHTGLVEATRGGTLYLSEIGEFPMAAQSRLLRLLETGAFRPVGGCRTIQADLRLVCSTSDDPQRLVDTRRLMPELLLRISGLSIHVPPLRERLEDLELLVETQLREVESCLGCRLGEGTLAALSAYAYPGNLRELNAALQHACILAVDGVILPEHLPDRIGPTPPGVASPLSRA